MSDQNQAGFAPTEVTTLLRIEGLAAFAVAVGAFYMLGGNWWLFAALILAPDLSMFGLLAGYRVGSRVYNVAHTYTLPLALGTVAWLTGTGWLVIVALVWIAHIGVDRALGYGLRYPLIEQATHLGWVGKAKRRAGVADAR